MFRAFAPTVLDFYKVDHRRQYPEGTQLVYSNFTPRSDRYFVEYLARSIRASWDNKVVFFGLQAICIKFLIQEWKETFFDLPEDKAVAKFTRRMLTSLGPNGIGEDHIRALHRLGYLPVEIKALPEGSLVNIKVPCYTVKNTIPAFFWVTNALETAMSDMTWKFINSATIAKEFRKLLNKYAKATGTSAEFVQWQGHDFSFRGMSGLDDAMMSGAGHLLSFTGTDTIPAIDLLEDFYGADAEKELVGGSVSATEHSVTSLSIMQIVKQLKRDGTYGGRTVEEIWGDGHMYVDLKLVAELIFIERLVSEVYPTGIVSNVSDTYDFWSVITRVAPRVKDKLLARDGKYVFRPDSGDPVRIVSGMLWKDVPDGIDTIEIAMLANSGIEAIRYKGRFYDISLALEMGVEELDISDARPLPEHEVKGAIQCLYETFGGSPTDTGHIMLNPKIGLIYGDSITLDRAEAILSRLMAKGFASGNVVFGIGSFTYERQTRDTFGFAMKATAGVVDGELLEIFKDPKTDGGGTKKSAKGLLRVEKEGNDFRLYDRQSPEEEAKGALETVFKDGKMVKVQTLAEIRERLLNAISA